MTLVWELAHFAFMGAPWQSSFCPTYTCTWLCLPSGLISNRFPHKHYQQSPFSHNSPPTRTSSTAWHFYLLAFTCPPLSDSDSHHFTIEPLLSVASPIIFIIRTLTKFEKQICNLSSQEIILNHCTWTQTCYPLGHWCTFAQLNLKHKVNVKSLW